MSLSESHLLQTEDECLGTENLVCLSGFTQSLLDDVAIIIIILRQKNKTVKNMQDDKLEYIQSHVIYRFSQLQSKPELM